MSKRVPKRTHSESESPSPLDDAIISDDDDVEPSAIVGLKLRVRLAYGKSLARSHLKNNNSDLEQNAIFKKNRRRTRAQRSVRGNVVHLSAAHSAQGGGLGRAPFGPYHARRAVGRRLGDATGRFRNGSMGASTRRRSGDESKAMSCRRIALGCARLSVCLFQVLLLLALDRRLGTALLLREFIR